ncbi:hypothetical protein MUN88_19130 [Gracilibacillus caseinilyticus]|uniref:Uncharacterized protein n=1 Tax=Gracilibacillus caseinilyticus TaxID=2932256 RepID=A0ABY4EV84_9BACI|nr:hypothetical protein [Gracilibacillus caseinilyticus]UOQ48133.1 hypothetical protein MUN88_19130 [Gracilibacillus caseinilyticus]
MSYYDKAEQETIYTYDVLEKRWRVYSTYPPDIRQLLGKAEMIAKTTDEAGRIISFDGYVDRNQVRLFKPKI